MMRSWAYNCCGVLMGTSWRASCPRWLSLRGDSLPMITLLPSQGDFCATAVIDIIEATLDVSFDEPFGPVPCVMDFCQGRLASPFRSETMAVVRKLWLIVGF